ncbi:hypothetical protein HK096_010389 [Nowakowskiella sp. JEL0078]|nr:hypothetical protein HK096_010389 [Nowakowskiella sp. JEL0078]
MRRLMRQFLLATVAILLRLHLSPTLVLAQLPRTTAKVLLTITTNPVKNVVTTTRARTTNPTLVTTARDRTTANTRILASAASGVINIETGADDFQVPKSLTNAVVLTLSPVTGAKSTISTSSNNVEAAPNKIGGFEVKDIVLMAVGGFVGLILLCFVGTKLCGCIRRKNNKKKAVKVALEHNKGDSLVGNITRRIRQSFSRRQEFPGPISQPRSEQRYNAHPEKYKGSTKYPPYSEKRQEPLQERRYDNRDFRNDNRYYRDRDNETGRRDYR